MSDLPSALDVLDFWWSAGPEKWYAGSDEFDAEIRDKFLALYEAAAAGNLDTWMDAPASALALTIVLDQFSRNMFRKNPRAFAADGKALKVAQNSVAQGFDRAYGMPGKQFFLMPFQHSEDMDIQEQSLDLFRTRCDDNGYHYALIHMDVIRRFGRFPHRNTVLGRQSTAQEQAYLDADGFSA